MPCLSKVGLVFVQKAYKILMTLRLKVNLQRAQNNMVPKDRYLPLMRPKFSEIKLHTSKILKNTY